MHPARTLFDGDTAPAALPVCDHRAASETLIRAALALQRTLGPVFDVTADCADGAEVGQEARHAGMVAGLLASADNAHDRMGVRIHDPRHRSWHTDLELLIAAAGERIAYVTIPKVDSAADVERVVHAIDDVAAQHGVRREIPVQVLIETHGALRAAADIAALPRVECLCFGLADYVSAFGGAIPAEAAVSPIQFEHPLVRRAKTEVSVAAHAHGKVPSHNACFEAIDVARPATDGVDDPAPGPRDPAAGDRDAAAGAAAGQDAARALREFGFTRMASLHAAQVRPIVAALTPAPQTVHTACEILLAGARAHWEPTRHAGRLHDRASYRHWWGVLCRAHAAGAPIPPEAARTFFA